MGSGPGLDRALWKAEEVEVSLGKNITRVK